MFWPWRKSFAKNIIWSSTQVTANSAAKHSVSPIWATKPTRLCRICSPAWTTVSDSKPAPDPAFIAKIFFAEFSFEIAFFAANNQAIDKDKTNWNSKQHPNRITKDRSPKRPKSEADVHWVTGETIKPVRNNFSARGERNWISPSPLLGKKAANIQSDAYRENHAAKNPTKRAVNETGGDQPLY